MKTFNCYALHSTVLVALMCSGCLSTEQGAQPAPVKVAARPKSTLAPKPRPTSTPTRSQKRAEARQKAKAERKARRDKAGAEEQAKANVAFDVPALLGRSIEQVRDRLGPLEDKGLEDDDDGEMSWTKRKAGLLVDYDQSTRETTGFFVNHIYGEPLPNDQLLAMANVRQGDPRYTLEFVPAFGSEPKSMGVKIIPN